MIGFGPPSCTTPGSRRGCGSRAIWRASSCRTWCRTATSCASRTTSSASAWPRSPSRRIRKRTGSVAAPRTIDAPCPLCGNAAARPVWTTRDRALGVPGIETDAAAAEKARQFADTVWTGDALSAPFPPGQFDVVSAFHVLEHVPDPVTLVRRMLDWLAPGGLLIIEVPNAGGFGASVFGSAWSRLELPRHLSHFTTASLARTVQQAGRQIAWCWHRTKPRHYLWSLRILLREQGWLAVARLTETRIVYGMLKLFLELTVPLISWAERGEVIRVGIHRKAQRAAC